MQLNELDGLLAVVIAMHIFQGASYLALAYYPGFFISLPNATCDNMSHLTPPCKQHEKISFS